MHSSIKPEGGAVQLPALLRLGDPLPLGGEGVDRDRHFHQSVSRRSRAYARRRGTGEP
jgi:hypothetical protein